MKKEECNCNNSCGITSVILGLVGSVFGFMVFPIILSITGLAFGIAQCKREKNAWAIWGIVLSSLGIIISVWIFWQIITLLGNIQNTLNACAANPSAPGCEQIAQILGNATAK